MRIKAYKFERGAISAVCGTPDAPREMILAMKMVGKSAKPNIPTQNQQKKITSPHHAKPAGVNKPFDKSSKKSASEANKEKMKRATGFMNKEEWDKADADEKQSMYSKYIKLLGEQNAKLKKEGKDEIKKYEYIIEWERAKEKDDFDKSLNETRESTERGQKNRENKDKENNPITNSKGHEIKITQLENADVDYESFVPQEKQSKFDSIKDKENAKREYTEDIDKLSTDELIKKWGMPDTPEVKEKLDKVKEEIKNADINNQDTDAQNPDEETKNLPANTESTLTSPEKAKRDAKSLVSGIVDNALKLAPIADLADVCRGNTTVVKGGKRFITDSSKALGESILLKLLVYGGFSLLGPFGLILAHEGMSILKDTAEDIKDRDEKSKENRRERNVNSQISHVKNVIPSNFSQQVREQFRKDFGTLSKSELISRYSTQICEDYHKSIPLPSNFSEADKEKFLQSADNDSLDEFQEKYGDLLPKDYEEKRKKLLTDFSDKIGEYATYETQIQKLSSAIPDKDGMYSVNLYGDVSFKGNEKELKEHIKTLKERADGYDYENDEYGSKSSTKVKIPIAKTEFRKQLSGISLKDKKGRSVDFARFSGKDCENFSNSIRKMYDLDEKDTKDLNIVPMEYIAKRLEQASLHGDKTGEYSVQIFKKSYGPYSDFEELKEEVMGDADSVAVKLASIINKKKKHVVEATDLEPEILAVLPNDLRSKIKEVHKDAPEGKPKKEPKDDSLIVKESEVNPTGKEETNPIEEDSHKDKLMDKLVNEGEASPEDTANEEVPKTAEPVIEPKETPEPITEGDEEHEVVNEEVSDADVVADTVEKIVEYYLKQDPVKLRAKFEKKYPKLLAKYNKKKEEEKQKEESSRLSLEELDI